MNSSPAFGLILTLTHKSLSHSDIVEGFSLGRITMLIRRSGRVHGEGHAAMAGKTDIVVSKLYGRYVHLPLGPVTRRRRKLNLTSPCWQAVLESTGQHQIILAPV